MRVANLNPKGLVFSILPVKLPGDPGFTRGVHRTPEQIAARVADGEHMVFLGDAAETPPYGHRYDPDENNFVPDEKWLSDTHEIVSNGVAAISGLADMYKQIATRLAELPDGALHPLERQSAQALANAHAEQAAQEQAKADDFAVRLADVRAGKIARIAVSP